jgi:membrane associated rhomboid family serine protease
MSNPNVFKSAAKSFRAQVTTLGIFVAIMWVVEILDVFIFQQRLDYLGIIPRNMVGLRGIILAPFIHGGFPHLIANTVPFVTLGWFVMLRRLSDFWVVTIVTTMVSGLGVWIFGAPNSVHIGASGLIFGYLGFLLLRGYFERSVLSIVFSIAILIFYGGLLWGVLPVQQGVSWQGHLFGFVGGGLAAWLLAEPSRARQDSDPLL